MSDTIVEFVGLTQRAASLVEHFRVSKNETKAEILIRVLAPLVREQVDTDSEFDLGQGASLRVGEQVFLFLSKDAKTAGKAHGVAEVRNDGFYLFDKKVAPSKGSVIHPAMQLVQRKLNHRNSAGELISLSAWRQWHVMREGKLTPLLELKDPKLARTRGRASLVSAFTASSLGL